MLRETSAKQTNAQTQARQPKKEMVEILVHTYRRSPPKQQKATVTTPKASLNKNALIFNPQISREFRFNQFVYTVRNISNRICKTASKFGKEIVKIGRCMIHVLSNMENVAVSRCFVTTKDSAGFHNHSPLLTMVSPIERKVIYRFRPA